MVCLWRMAGKGNEKKAKQGEKTELCQITEELHWNQWQRVLWKDKEEQKAATIQRRALNILQDAWRSILEDYLKK